MTHGARQRRTLGRVSRAGVTAIAVVCIIACGGGAAVPTPPHCPEMTVASIDRYDFAAEMKIQPPISAKLRAGIDTALVVNKLADDVETNLKQACLTYLADLGVRAQPAKSSADACNALVQALESARSKLGIGTTILVDYAPPVCAASIDAADVCSGQCDPSVNAATAKSSCEPGTMQGSCDALCSGACDATAATACAGACIGACDAKIKGMCSGLCTGKCDGKPTGAKKGGACSGVCEGTCEGAVSGTCTGTCTGTCKLTTASPCVGSCTGSCSTEMKSAMCTGDISTPKMADECKAKCDAVIASTLTCSTAPVFVRISGATDPAAAQTFKAAAEKDLPPIAKIAIGLGEHIPGLIVEVTDAVDTVDKAVKASFTNPTSSAGVNGCFAKPISDVSLAGASLQGNVDLAVSVKACMSSGGSGGSAVIVPATVKAR